MKILIYDLPEKEVAYIKRNCKKEIENEVLTLHEWSSSNVKERNNITEIERETKVEEVHKIFAREAQLPDIVISKNSAMLQQAVNAGIAAIAYQNREKVAHEEESLPQVSIIVEGFEEVDGSFFERVWQRHNGIPWTILETERLIVRELTLDDMDALFELYSYEGMTDYMEGLYPYEEEYAYQKAYIESMYGFFGYGMWLVFEKESKKLVGRAGVEHREALDGELELGYAIGTPWQGRGYATEVCEGIIK